MSVILRRSSLAATLAIILFATLMFRGVVLPQVNGMATVLSAVGLAAIFLASPGMRVPRAYMWGVLAMVALVATGWLVHRTSADRLMLGAWFAFAFTLYFLVFNQVRLDVSQFMRLMCAVLVVLIFVSAIGCMQAILYPRPASDFVHPLAFMRGQTAVVGNAVIFYAAIAFQVVLGLALNIHTGRGRYIFVAAASTLLVVATGSRKLIVAIVLLWALWAFLRGRRTEQIFALIGVTILGGLLAILAGDVLLNRFLGLEVYLQSGSDVARNALYYYAFSTANDYFPFGAGLGMYGSVPAAYMYSPLYYAYGFEHVYGLQPYAIGSGNNYLMDTFWPQVIGEIGYVGTLIYLCLWVYPMARVIQRLRKVRHSQDPRGRGLIFLVAGIAIVVCLESIGSPLPSNPLGLFMVGGLCTLAWHPLQLLLRPAQTE
jgi:hypothetical protein